MASKAAIKMMNWRNVDRLQKVATVLSAHFNVEPFQLNKHTQYTRDPELILVYQMEDIANWVEKLAAHVSAESAPAKED